MTVWYHVRDLDAGRRFYREALGFTETYFDAAGGWAVSGGLERWFRLITLVGVRRPALEFWYNNLAQ